MNIFKTKFYTNRIIFIPIVTLFILLQLSCNKNKGNEDPNYPENPSTPTYISNDISTDKAIYNPGDVITFSLESTSIPEDAKVRYKKLNEVVEENTLTGSSWTWTAPAQDFTGYMIDIYDTDGDEETIYASIAIDVSSDWTKFPRYGFLSDYSILSDETINSVIENLNRHHINGIQFYDWHNKHHKPLPIVNSSPASTWKDISNRDIYFSTVEKYINAAHNKNIKAMFYNLVFGAWNNAEADGVKPEWYIYNDNTHTNIDFHSLPSPPFLSNIFLLDPSNTQWQDYIGNENQIIYNNLDFDGYHMDQLGDRGTRYKYDGSVLYLNQAYSSFISAMNTDDPSKNIVMNAVNQYGQQEIAEAASDFLYTEIWSPYDNYSDLANIIKQNNTYGNNSKNTVLAAYMDYDLADNTGYFNTPGVLLTNAVIFAFGGAHLELGEHMLCKEYFPTNTLTMKPDLNTAILHYYDFLVAYENLLRDGGTFNSLSITSTDDKMQISNWPADNGEVAAVSKLIDNRQIIHLINFKNSTSQEWRDKNGTQVIPAIIYDANISIETNKTVKKLWIASPDFIGGTSRDLNFVQNNDTVYFTLPELKYWCMLVLEYE